MTDINSFLDANLCEYELNRNTCLNSCQISSGWVESNLTKKSIPILYLPWWDNNNSCVACKSVLYFKSHNQKYCVQCCIIYIGCRYCLTTNIIFGFINQSQCKKCKRMLFITIDVTSISSGNSDLDDFLFDPECFNSLQLDETISKEFDYNPAKIYDFINNKYKEYYPEPKIEWIPSPQITNMKKIAIGGFGIIYQAIWSDGPLIKDGSSNYIRTANKTVIVKRFVNSQDIGKYFLNEVSILIYMYLEFFYSKFINFCLIIVKIKSVLL